jgi:hypothetical protein
MVIVPFAGKVPGTLVGAEAPIVKAFKPAKLATVPAPDI